MRQFVYETGKFYFIYDYHTHKKNWNVVHWLKCSYQWIYHLLMLFLVQFKSINCIAFHASLNYHWKERESISHSVMPDSLRPHGLPWPTKLLCPWNSLGKNTGVSCHSLLHGIFPTQGLKPGILLHRQILYCLNHLVLSNKTFWNNANILYPHCPIQQ